MDGFKTISENNMICPNKAYEGVMIKVDFLKLFVECSPLLHFVIVICLVLVSWYFYARDFRKITRFTGSIYRAFLNSVKYAFRKLCAVFYTEIYYLCRAGFNLILYSECQYPG